MLKSPLTRISLCLAVLTLIGVAALASRTRRNFVLTSDGRMAIATHGPSSVTPRDNGSDTTLTTIAGNLSTYFYGAYFCCYGVTIAEGGANHPSQNWQAIAFTPKADATITKIEASVGTLGENGSGFELSVNADNGGIPGVMIKSFHIKSPPAYGDCCALDIGNAAAGIPVIKGTRYWIVASTTAADTEFLGAWAYNTTDMRPAYLAATWCVGAKTYCGTNSGKWVAYNTLLPGFAVLGN